MTMYSLYYVFLFFLYLFSFLTIIVSLFWFLYNNDCRKKHIFLFQLKIEKKLKSFKNISFEHFLMSLIGFSSIQALYQFLTIKALDPWQDKQVLEFINDPVFYIGLTLTFLLGLLFFRKIDKLKR